ncbi:MAG: PD-(D/E)XK nuclease family protein [Clostridia bacterium]|nr:PD-(D/E)XK nuclease family protein [Clostridia bacterium]
MKVTFLYGRSGCGKTYTIAQKLRRSAERNIRSFLIVPEQQSHTVERRMLTLLPPSAQLTNEALSFTRLANRVFRQYGGLSYHYATAGVRALLMWRRLCELAPLLEEYGEQAKSAPSLTELMLQTVGELKGCSISPAKLEHAAEKLPKDSSLYHRLRDISLIYAAYQNELSAKYDDTSDDLSRLSEVLREHRFFKGSHVYIDYFTSFTAQELDVIRHLFCQASEVTVALCCDGPHDTSLHLATIADTASRLHRLAEECGCEIEEVYLEGNKRTEYRELSLLEADLWHLEREAPHTDIPSEERGHLRLLHCADPYEEADAAAAIISKAVQSGARFRDFVVICRDAAQYEGILDAAMEKHRIPVFFSEKTDLSTLPLIKLILTALNMITHHFRQSDVLTHLKTGLCPYPTEDIDAFEGYVTTWRLRGKDFLRDAWNMNPDGYAAGNTLSPRAERTLAAANRVRGLLIPPLLQLQEDMEGAETVPDMCRALYRYLETIDVRSQLKESAMRDLARGDSGKGRAEETLRLYGTVLDVLDQLSVALSDSELTVEEFATALKLMFDRTQLSSIPDTVDQVLIGSASMLRTEEPACAILLGLAEGIFPKAVQDDGIFTDTDKKTLEQIGITLASNSDMRASDELYFVYRAITAPSRELILITSDNDCDGKSRLPSLPYLRTAKLFPYLTQEIYGALPAEDRIWKRETALEALPDIRDAALKNSLCEALRKEPEFAARLETLHIPVSDADCTVSPALSRTLFPPRLSMSQSRIEKYVLCHFGYYCTYVLNLREEQTARIRTSDIGSLVHTVMETFFRRIADRGIQNGPAFADAMTDGECELMVDHILQEYLKNNTPEGQAPSNRTRHLLVRLRRLTLLLIDNLREEFRHSHFTPTFFELNINHKNLGTSLPTPLEIRLDDGETVSMHGIVDRVDAFVKDGDVYLRIVDYKTGKKEFSLEDVRRGLNMQLIIYLFTLLKNSPKTFQEQLKLGEGGRLLPAGAIYLTANVPPFEIDEDLSREEILTLAEKKLTRSGPLLNDPDILHAFHDQLDPEFIGEVKRTTDKATGDTVLSGKHLLDSEGFRTLGLELEETVRAIATSMKSGNAHAKPLVDKSTNACAYCAMRAICRSASAQKKF